MRVFGFWLTVLLTLSATTAAQAERRNFKAWSVSCTEALCVAQTVTQGGRVRLQIKRSSDSDAGWSIGFTDVQRDVAPNTPVTVSVDNRPSMSFAPGTGYIATQDALLLEDPVLVPLLLEALRAGGRATLTFSHRQGLPIGLRFSLAGLSASLLWMDEQQDRGAAEPRVSAAQPEAPVPPAPAEPEASSSPDTSTLETSAQADTTPSEPSPAEAVQKETSPPAETTKSETSETTTSEASPEKSSERETSVTAAQPQESAETDTQTAPADAPKEPVKVPAAVKMLHLADGECRDFEEEHMVAARVADSLDEHRTFYLLPCYTGAYNVIYRAYVFDKRYPDALKRQLFVGFSEQLGWYGKDTLINAEYDPKTKTLSAFEKGRGLGDCGSLPTYRWQQFAWRLLQFRNWDKCDGSRLPDQWPVVYEHPDYDKS